MRFQVEFRSDLGWTDDETSRGLQLANLKSCATVAVYFRSVELPRDDLQQESRRFFNRVAVRNDIQVQAMRSVAGAVRMLGTQLALVESPPPYRCWNEGNANSSCSLWIRIFGLMRIRRICSSLTIEREE